MKHVERTAIMCTALAALCTAAVAVESGKIDAARLKPEALYVDLANPTNARGISLGDEELEVTERGGQTVVVFKRRYVWVKLDPARVRPETPMLVAIGYYDPEQYGDVAGDLQSPDRPHRLSVQGFVDKPNRKGGYTTGSVVAPSHAGAWRWWTVFTYANYGMRANRGRPSFALNSRLGARWIVVLPLTGESEKALHGIRDKALAMLANYGRLIVAEAALQEVRGRLEQGLRYAGEENAAKATAVVLEEVKAGAWQARIDMNSVITDVLFATDSAYLGLFDGNERDRAAALERFHQKVRRLLERYRALTAKGERAMLARVQAQCVQLGLEPVELREPERLAPDHVIKREDFRNRFFIGYKGQEPVLQLPRRFVDVISQDLGIDLTYDSSYTLVVPLEDGSYDFSAEENVDCLVCHDRSGTYVKGKGGYPAAGVDLIAVARNVGSPTRENCGSCHFRGGGGDAVKHGDLDASLTYPRERVDVHMGKHRMLCTDCHRTRDHLIAGRSITVSVDNTNQISCTDCHVPAPHLDERLNLHTRTVACQTCHIPQVALREATKTHWDWSAAGQDREEDPHEYLKIKGSFEYEKQLIPRYYWYNGIADRYFLGDRIDPEGVTALNPPRGGYDDPSARIWPFKVHTGSQIYDAENLYFLQPKTAGQGGFWTEFDWDKAARLGSKAAGLEYSGKFGFARTEMFWPLTHMIAPTEESLQCTDCHGGDRMDWEALGYPGDPLNWGSRFAATAVGGKKP